MNTPVLADLFCVSRNGAWHLTNNDLECNPTNKYEEVAKQTFDQFCQESSIRSWDPARELIISDESRASFLRRKAKQTVRELDQGVFVRSAKIWPSNAVLAAMTPRLLRLGYLTEIDSPAELSFPMPFVENLYGQSNSKRFGASSTKGPVINVDAYHPSMKIGLQIEAGQAFENKNYLRNFFEAVVLSNSETDRPIEYFGIAFCRRRIVGSRTGKGIQPDDFPGIATRLYGLYCSLQPQNLEGFFLLTY